MTRYITFLLLLLPAGLFSQTTITVPDIDAASKIASLRFSESEKDSMLSGLQNRAAVYDKMHRYNLDNNVPVPFTFSPVLPGMRFSSSQEALQIALPETERPSDLQQLAFYNIPQLAYLIKNKKVSSVELTRFFLSRLKKFGDTLHCVIEITDSIALKEAEKADRELAEGQYRGLLHGIPYGLKDLFAVKGTKTTWGARPYKDQVLDYDSYVYTRLREAGAVLVAKLTTGALAMNDYWFGGRTRNPWNVNMGSSGSSSGPASATVAGLVPFSIGTETYGSIISPSTICGATGLRPTFGSISRYGAMTLCWSLDKAGPICRSAEDAAIVFYYLHGTDGLDESAVKMPFNYSGQKDIRKLRVGFASNYFNSRDTLGNENKVLDILRQAGVTLTPLNFPDSSLYPFDIIGTVIGAESAASFDGFTRTGLDDQMVRQGKGEWPNYFRTARFIPAVEYLNANRHRYLLMEKVNGIFKDFDVIVFPTWAGRQVAITNLTGHPAITIPTGFNKRNLPTGITFVGNLYDEANLIRVAKAVQDLTDWNKQHPQLFQP